MSTGPTGPTGRVAVVTGADRGIGREVARQLADHGLDVVVGARDAGKGRVVAAEIGADSHPRLHEKRARADGLPDVQPRFWSGHRCPSSVRTGLSAGSAAPVM